VSASTDPTAAELEAARHGDREAMERVLAVQEPRLYRFGLRLCGDPELAKDVLQESMLAVARGLSAFEGRASLSSWLYAIARSACIKQRRRRAGQPGQEGSIEQDLGPEHPLLVDPAPWPDAQAEAHQSALRVQAALARLEPEQREAVVLRDLEGLSAAEAATVVGVGVAALKSRLHRGRAALRLALVPSPDALPRPTSSCPDIVALYSAKLEGDISAQVCAQVESHVQGCAPCRAACASLQDALALCRQSPGPEVPADVQAEVRAAVRAALDPG
jgi:RNA polymerase sigma-70 factor (ECF subfamily)